MQRDVFTLIVGGKAGQGAKKAGAVAAAIFADLDRAVFQYDDYPSLIRGGHNFAVVSTAPDEISSHYLAAQLVVALDALSYKTHLPHLAPGGLMVFNSEDQKQGEGIGLPLTTLARKYPPADLRLGITSTAVLCAAMDLTKEQMKAVIEREYRRDLENNVAYANELYDLIHPQVAGRVRLAPGHGKQRFLAGSETIGLGAMAAGLDLYLAYPMTPTSTLLHFMAARGPKVGVTVMHPENEIAVANIGVGATFAGARTMVGTSGGGFSLMEEAFSLAGMVEAPMLFMLGMRPGPATGVPTYSLQGELSYALAQGHGEFPRIVACPGEIAEGYALAAEMLSLVWRFQTPGILLTDKHFTECSASVTLDLEQAEWAEPAIRSLAAIGAKLGVKALYVDTPFDSIILSVTGGKNDMIMADMYDNPDREKVLSFVEYAYDGTSIMVLKGDPTGRHGLDGLSGKRVTVLRGSTQQALLEKLNKQFKSEGKAQMTILTLQGSPEGLLAIEGGKAVAQLTDHSQAAYAVNSTVAGKPCSRSSRTPPPRTATSRRSSASASTRATRSS